MWPHVVVMVTMWPPSVNTAFSQLRDLIPTEPLDRKLSKIETLRLATSYIRHLAVQVSCPPAATSIQLAAEGPEGAPCHLAGGLPQFQTGERRSRAICTFCVASNKRNKMDKVRGGTGHCSALGTGHST